MAQQSAVEWMVEQLRMQTPLYTKNQIIEIAKEMEKEQIMDACVKFGNNNGVDIDDYEEYYNETYNK